jgi:hypothetical protein
LAIRGRAQTLHVFLQVRGSSDALFKARLSSVAFAQSQALFVDAFGSWLATPFGSTQFVGVHDTEPFGEPDHEIRPFLRARNLRTGTVLCFENATHRGHFFFAAQTSNCFSCKMYKKQLISFVQSAKI